MSTKDIKRLADTVSALVGRGDVAGAHAAVHDLRAAVDRLQAEQDELLSSAIAIAKATGSSAAPSGTPHTSAESSEQPTKSATQTSEQDVPNKACVPDLSAPNKQTVEQLSELVHVLDSRCAEYERDAMRYRFLRAQGVAYLSAGRTLDAAIDGAISRYRVIRGDEP